MKPRLHLLEELHVHDRSGVSDLDLMLIVV